VFHGEKVYALVAAAGESRRMGGQDKLLSRLAGVPVLARTVEVFLSSPLVDEIVVVLRQERLAAGRQLAAERGWPAQVRFCQGGDRRLDSVRLGLEEIAGEGWVLIHDGARPLFTAALITQGLEAAAPTGAAIPGIPPVDTIKVITHTSLVKQTLPREQLRAIQTPQVFRLALIREAHRKFATSAEPFTDDAAMLEALGWPVAVFAGEVQNWKITTPEDLQRAEAWWEDTVTAEAQGPRRGPSEGPPRRRDR
jgi:2-C-methyl-D-erythritol 4-phosphate cytidylyltransferase